MAQALPLAPRGRGYGAAPRPRAGEGPRASGVGDAWCQIPRASRSNRPRGRLDAWSRATFRDLRLRAPRRAPAHERGLHRPGRRDQIVVVCPCVSRVAVASSGIRQQGVGKRGRPLPGRPGRAVRPPEWVANPGEPGGGSPKYGPRPNGQQPKVVTYTLCTGVASLCTARPATGLGFGTPSPVPRCHVVRRS